ncbi:MAG: polyphosphate kinase 2 [Paracoccaceae bacterium]
MNDDLTTLPFDGEISRFFRHGAPDDIRAAVANAGTDPIFGAGFPYRTRWKRKDYEATMAALQIELVKLQAWSKATGQRIAIVFEGRDAAGKGGTIKRFRENINPRSARVVALAKPTETERGQWYFQRYIAHMPSTGEIVFFDRSWYNRAVIEHVFGFCDAAQRDRFFDSVAAFEKLLIDDGIRLFKIWLNVDRAEQLRRFLSRERDPLKQWKLSKIDVMGLAKWDAYTSAIVENFSRTHAEYAPWTVVRADDKRRARVAAMRSVLSAIDYDHKDPVAAQAPDPLICGGPDLWHG